MLRSDPPVSKIVDVDTIDVDLSSGPMRVRLYAI